MLEVLHETLAHQRRVFDRGRLLEQFLPQLLLLLNHTLLLPQTQHATM